MLLGTICAEVGVPIPSCHPRMPIPFTYTIRPSIAASASIQFITSGPSNAPMHTNKNKSWRFGCSPGRPFFPARSGYPPYCGLPPVHGGWPLQLLALGMRLWATICTACPMPPGGNCGVSRMAQTSSSVPSKRLWMSVNDCSRNCQFSLSRLEDRI